MNINNLDNDIKKYKQQVALGEALVVPLLLS
nr:MAG TPA: hypothetical protein [Caudoviricetes sp.]